MHNYAPWITENIKFMQKCMQKFKNQALRKLRQTKLPKHCAYYKQLRNYTLYLKKIYAQKF